MNVMSVQQTDEGALVITFDVPKYDIVLAPMFVNVPRYDLTFILDAAKQVFDGIPQYDLNTPEPPVDLVLRSKQLADIVAGVYLKPSGAPPTDKKKLN